jgi:hypothetical protein
VNSEKLHLELKKARLPVVGVSSSGRVDYSRPLTATEHETADAVIASHDSTVTNVYVFIERLAAAGISRDDVLYALWKSMTEGDNLGKDKLIETIGKD